MKKRILSAILALCMVLTLLPLSVLAEDVGTDDIYDVGADTGILPTSSSSDYTPPVITGVYMNNPGGKVKRGDTLYFDIKVEDESAIGYAELRFSLAEAQGGNWISAWLESYNDETKIAKVKLDIQDNIASGTWKLTNVSVEDYYGNYANYYPGIPDYPDSGNPGEIDFDSVYFTVVETSDDVTAPVVTTFSMDTPGKTVTVGDTLHFNIKVEDESAIKYAELRFSLAEAQGGNWISAWLESYDDETKVAKVRLDIQDNIASGTWKLDRVSVTDYYGNSASHYPGDPNYPDSGNPGNIDFDSVHFTVVETSNDITAPVVTTFSMDTPGKTVTVGDTLYFNIKVEDESVIRYAELRFSLAEAQGGNWISAWLESYDDETKAAKVKLDIRDNIASGTWKLDRVSVIDYYGNSASHYLGDPNYPEFGNPGNIDFDSVYFIVASNNVPPEAVSIPETLSLPVRTTATITPTVEPATSVPKWTWTSSDTSVATVNSSGNGKTCNVTGVSSGTTTITGTTQNGLTATCTVTVTDAPMPESGTVDESYQIGVGGFVDIVPVLAPADATTLYEVTSDNPHVASAATTGGNTGVRIQGNVPGTATITIRGANNLVMTTTITVGKSTDTQHEKTTYPGYAATCTARGWTDAVRCSACWYVFTEAEEIPATGHNYGSDGRCIVCGERRPANTPSGSSGGSSGSSSSGSSGSSGNSSSTSSGSTSQNISAGDQKLPVTVSGDTVNVSATDQQIKDAIADSAVTGVVEIDMTSIKDASEVKIPQKMVDAIQNSNDVSGLSVTAQSGSIEMSAAALSTVSNALTGNGDQLSLKIDTVDVNKIASTQKYPIANVLNTAVFVELSAAVIHQDGSRDPIHEFNGDVTVSIPYEQPANVAGRQVIACYIADDGAITYFPVRYENGMVTFTTTHFSTFGIVESYAAAFRDINVNDWYMLAVEYALGQKLMNGIGNNLFAPNANLSRAMLAQILYNKEGNPASYGGNAFADVQSGTWYADAVAWASQEGIVGGYGNGSFGPNDNITREQLAVMLWRYAGQPAAPNLVLNFSDANKVSDYARDALRWAVGKGIINGKGNGILDPTGKATRAEAAKVLKSYMDAIL